MRNTRELMELAAKHNVKTTQRRWFERRNDEGKWETVFMDLPRPKADIAAELRELGVMQ